MLLKPLVTKATEIKSKPVWQRTPHHNQSYLFLVKMLIPVGVGMNINFNWQKSHVAVQLFAALSYCYPQSHWLIQIADLKSSQLLSRSLFFADQY